MDLSDYRKIRGLSQSACAKELGLRSKAYISRIETGQQSVPMKLALKIERWSNGEVKASELLPAEEAALLPASQPAAA